MMNCQNPTFIHSFSITTSLLKILKRIKFSDMLDKLALIFITKIRFLLRMNNELNKG